MALLGGFGGDGPSRAALSQHPGAEPLLSLLLLHDAAAAAPSRRAALLALGPLCAEPALLRPEAFAAARHGGVAATPLLRRLLRVLRDAVAAAPHRAAPVLGFDGRPRAFEPRPGAAEGEADHVTPALAALRACLRASPGNAAKALHAADALDVLTQVAAFASPPLQRAAEAAAGALAAGAAAAATSICEGSDLGLLAGCLRAGDAALAERAAERLAALLPSSTGDSYDTFIAVGGGLAALHATLCATEAKQKPPPLGARAALLAGLERGRGAAALRRGGGPDRKSVV